MCYRPIGGIISLLISGDGAHLVESMGLIYLLNGLWVLAFDKL